MRLYFAGICGTFMGSLALIARECGMQVRGCDAGVYPPMSEQLAQQGIAIDEGYSPSHLAWGPELVVIGNALSRGNPLVEAVLDGALPYTSGPQWLSEAVLSKRHVLAIAGTHGKTTVSSMLAWILRESGNDCGYLIGGLAPGLGVSGRLGASEYFVIEADEYDTAFFDKRSKFVHYRPRSLLINNIEYDHADIFPDLAAIERQFHHLVRTVPSSGVILHPTGDSAIEQVLAMGCWSKTQTFGALGTNADWQIEGDFAECRVSRFDANEHPEQWSFRPTVKGRHNLFNALAAIALAANAGVHPEQAVETMQRFAGVRRRMDRVGSVGGIDVFDDFAHHPTEINATLQGFRERNIVGRLIAVIEPRSNSMQMGVHESALPAAVSLADCVYWYRPPSLNWDLTAIANNSPGGARVFDSIDRLVHVLVDIARPGDCIVVMSNGDFGGIHRLLVDSLAEHC